MTTPIGASTGYLSDHRGDWPALLDHAAEVSRSVVEISALSGPELPGLVEFLDGDRTLDFGYVAVHGPTKAVGPDDGALASTLCRLPDVVQTIVLHPDAMRDPVAFRIVGSRLVLENMDARKSDGRFPHELDRYFDLLPEAGFCFDLAHVRSLDPSMQLGHELLDRFADRLRQIHLSSLGPTLGHVMLTRADLALFESILGRCPRVPIVLEAPPPEWLTTTL